MFLDNRCNIIGGTYPGSTPHEKAVAIDIFKGNMFSYKYDEFIWG